MKSKRALIIAVILLLLVIGAGVAVVKNLTKPLPKETSEVEVENLPPVDPSVVVALTPKEDKTAVILTVSNIPETTQSLEYELKYVTGEGLPKGAYGKITLDAAREITREILLGTCSRNVCTYDKGMTSISLVLRFNSPEGASQFTKEYPLE